MGKHPASPRMVVLVGYERANPYSEYRSAPVSRKLGL